MPTNPTAVYERIYKKLDKLGVLDVKDHKILKSEEGLMDLHIEKIGKDTYALTHYFEQNGDLVPDPDIEIRVYPKIRMAEALTYQDQWGFQTVYTDDGGVNIGIKHGLNQFLDTWLTNMLRSGYEEKVKGMAMGVGSARKSVQKKR